MKNPNELIIPALRAHIGDWVYYVTFLRMDQIADQIHIAQEIHSSNVLKDMIQRQITNRAGQISDYLLKQPQRFFNSLIIGVYGGSPDWYELKIGPNRHPGVPELPLELGGVLGILRLDGTQTFFAIDGQHRVEGVKQALKRNSELSREEISVIFVAHQNDPDGMERTRRLFTTLNRYAKPVSKSEIVALDEDDIIAITTRELVEKHPLFQEKISLSKTKAIAVKDHRSFTTIITLYDVLEILFKTARGWAEFKRHRPEDSTIAEYYANSKQFWDTLVKYFPPLREILTSEPDKYIAGRYRNREGGHLLFRPVGLLIIAQVVCQARDSGLSEREAIKRISEVSMELTDEPWVGLLWDKINQRMISGTVPQKVARQLLFHCIGGDLTDMKTDMEAVRREYAGLLNRDASEVKLHRQYTSLL
ncbi:MAG: DGQHR domain-containing protein [Candidatus Poribacteria bacterium]|nr:DGQHR domain-containing protein [Candidatus Poribacteria bacterium]